MLELQEEGFRVMLVLSALSQVTNRLGICQRTLIYCPPLRLALSTLGAKFPFACDHSRVKARKGPLPRGDGE